MSMSMRTYRVIINRHRDKGAHGTRGTAAGGGSAAVITELLRVIAAQEYSRTRRAAIRLMNKTANTRACIQTHGNCYY